MMIGNIVDRLQSSRYDFWRPKRMPVEGPSYLVGRTDGRYYEKGK